MTFPASSSAASHLLFRADRVLVFAAVLAAVVSTAGAGGGLCPATCRCLERSTVVVCSDLVHVPPIPSNVVVLNLDHNRISLLQNSSLRGAETAASDGAGDGARTILRRLEVLSIEDNGLLYIEVGALSTLYELRVLRLGRNHLSTLPRELLAANRKLQVLDLHANYLASMPDGVVRHAHGLVMLNVSFNHLTSARLGDGFRHIGQLSVIDMSGNDIPTIDSDAFEAMQWWDEITPRHINLSYCNVRHVRSSAFRPVPRLVTLNLDGNPRLPQDQLEAALTNIRHQAALDVIRLSHGNVTDTLTLVRQLQSATNLTRLELSHNRIRSVGKRTFFFLSALRRLDLGHNEISSIDGFGGGLARLEYLDLSFNCLERLDASTFEGLHELRILDLSHNSLTGDFDAEPLLGLFNLHSVDVGYNRIRSFRIDDGGLESLETLSAAWNRVADLSFVRRLPRLRSLDVSHNVVERIPDDLLMTTRSGGLMTINRLNLSGNSISDVTTGAFRHATIDVIDLSYNRLTTLVNHGWTSLSAAASAGQQHQQQAVGGVRVLIVNDNFIANISDDAFDGLETSLVELRIERNSLSRLPLASTLGRMRRLRFLDVGWNPLGRFVETSPFSPSATTPSGAATAAIGSIGSLPHLETLRLNDVGLMSWPSALLQGGANLRTLDLAGNRIRTVPDDALTGMRRLRRVDLSRNRLSTFDPFLAGLPPTGAASDSEPATVVDLADNPLDCGCALEPLCRHLFPTTTDSGDDARSGDDDEFDSAARQERLHRRRLHLQLQNNSRTFRCRTPTEWNGVPLEEFCADTIHCSRLATTVAAAVAGVLSVVVVLLVTIVCCRRFRRRGGGIGVSTPVAGKGGMYSGAGGSRNVGKTHGRCRLDSYQFVTDETMLTSGSNASSASSNTTTTTSSGVVVPAHQSPPATMKSATAFEGSPGGNLQANLLMTKQWL